VSEAARSLPCIYLSSLICAAIALGLANLVGYLLPNPLKALIYQQLASFVSENSFPFFC
jgi:hypothetical protein